MVYYPTREYDYLNGAWDDGIIGLISTEQRDSVPRKANITSKTCGITITTWRFEIKMGSE